MIQQAIHTLKSDASAPRRDAGSAMIIALVFSIIIVFGLAGLLPMMLTEWKMSSRVSAQEAAFSLAESGVEEAIWAVVEFSETESAWTGGGWTESNDNKFWYKEWNLSDFNDTLEATYSLDDDRTALFRVIVQKVEQSSVQIISQGIISGGTSDASATRYIETSFTRTNPFDDFSLLAIFNIKFNGQLTADSFDPYRVVNGVRLLSDFQIAALLAVGDILDIHSQTTGDSASVGSLSTDADDIGMKNTTISGDIVTGATNDGTNPFEDYNMSGDVIYDTTMEMPKVVIPETGSFHTSLPSN